MKARIFIIFLLLSLFSTANAQITGTVSSIESVCLSNGCVIISNASSTSQYFLTGSGIPQIGPVLAMNDMVAFKEIPPGNYTITEFKLDNTQPTQSVTVLGNYEQNWTFNASVEFDPCVAGTPTVEITNFTITNASLSEQRPPYTYRISSKGGALPGDGSVPPPFLSVTSFNIPYPSGMNGNYEIQAKDACGNYKTINVYVPQTAPAPELNLSFDRFKDCAGDAVYNASATGGIPDYIYTIIAPSTDQVGTTKTSAGSVQFDLKAGGTYTIQAIDQCGGVRTRTVAVRPYLAPVASVRPGMGTCQPLPNGTGAFSIFASADGIGPYSAVVTNDCGEPIITINPLAIGSTPVRNLKRPCIYTVTVKDGCDYTASFIAELVPPGPNKLQAKSSISCPTGTSTEYVLNLDVDSLPPYNPSTPFTFHVKDSLGNYLPGYPLTSVSSFHNVALPPGDYTYQVTDACGADNSVTPFNILKYEDPSVTVDVVNICFGAGQAVVIGVNNNQLSPNTYNYSIAAGPTKVGQGPETDSAPNTGKFSSLQSEGTYTFSFNDGCKTVFTTVQIPKYSQPTYEVGFGALCPGNTTANLEMLNLQPEGNGLLVGPYRWRIISEDSDLYTSPLPFPNSVGQTSPIFANLPAKNLANGVATYMILGNDGCKNSFMGQGKIGVLPDETLVLNMTSICADGNSIIKARVSTPIVGGTYIYYRDGIEVARSTNLFTFIMNAMPGTYTARVFPKINSDPTCSTETPGVAVLANFEAACTVDSQPTCDDRNSGSASVSVINGFPPYSFVWSNGATTSSINGLSPGTYTVVATDASFCMVTCTVNVLAPNNCCDINAISIQSYECIENGTPSNMADNRLRVGVLATNLSTSLTTYNVTVQGNTATVTPSSGTYGTPTFFTLGPGSAGGGATFVLVLTDAVTGASCSRTINVTDPRNCDTQNPPGGCPTPQCGTATIQDNGN